MSTYMTYYMDKHTVLPGGADVRNSERQDQINDPRT